MADPSAGRGGVEALADRIIDLERLVRDLQAPSGTQQYNAVPALEAAIEDLRTQQATLVQQQATITAQQEVIVDLVDGLDQRVTDFINNNIDQIVTDKVTEKLGAADITIGRSGGVVRIPSITTTDVSTASGRYAVWVAGDGRVGHT